MIATVQQSSSIQLLEPEGIDLASNNNYTRSTTQYFAAGDQLSDKIDLVYSALRM